MSALNKPLLMPTNAISTRYPAVGKMPTAFAPDSKIPRNPTAPITAQKSCKFTLSCNSPLFAAG